MERFTLHVRPHTIFPLQGRFKARIRDPSHFQTSPLLLTLCDTCGRSHEVPRPGFLRISQERGESHLPGAISDVPASNLPPALRIHLHGVLLRLSNVSWPFLNRCTKETYRGRVNRRAPQMRTRSRDMWEIQRSALPSVLQHLICEDRWGNQASNRDACDEVVG